MADWTDGVSADPMAGRPVRCVISVLPSGVITVLRSPGCLPVDVMDACRAIGSGVQVEDVTGGAIQYMTGEQECL